MPQLDSITFFLQVFSTILIFWLSFIIFRQGIFLVTFRTIKFRQNFIKFINNIGLSLQFFLFSLNLFNINYINLIQTLNLFAIKIINNIVTKFNILNFVTKIMCFFNVIKIFKKINILNQILNNNLIFSKVLI